jgi:hypothetical protein
MEHEINIDVPDVHDYLVLFDPKVSYVRRLMSLLPETVIFVFVTGDYAGIEDWSGVRSDYVTYPIWIGYAIDGKYQDVAAGIIGRVFENYDSFRFPGKTDSEKS